jgi:BirA family biotin operon repressor/biotin-[acetyl-CoA-carboxylase] ligase
MSKMPISITKFDVVASTNDIAKDYPFGYVVVAEEQTKGKGRFGRKWDSGKGGLWFSIVILPRRKLFEYTFIASLAVFEGVGVEKAEIKWPNDVIYGNKKLCGILSEAVFHGDKAEKIIVGIGLNVNNKIPNELKETAISLKEIKGKNIDKDRLLGKILKNFGKMNSLPFSEILKKYKSKCRMLGKRIKVRTMDKTVKGKAVDIDNEGNLILETKGKKLKLNEGDVSIAKW